LVGKHDIEDDETVVEVDRDKSQTLGLLAHKMMEAVGSGRKLEDVLNSSHLNMPQDKIGIVRADVEEVWKYLSLLKDHPRVKEMEIASDSRSECEITKPFGKYNPQGRPDKVIKTPEGWKSWTFKFSSSESHSGGQ